MITNDVTVVARALEQVKDELKGQPIAPWLATPGNIALTNDNGDVALFEGRSPGVYCGHYFFHARGKDAVKAAEEFLKEFWSFDDVKTIIGFTPLHKKGALWLSQHLGFKSMEDEDIDGVPHRVFVMTRKDYE